jgi:hypothetical protein
MNSGKNRFGGGAQNSLYVPMSDVEQEVLARLAESGDLRVHVLEWGVINKPVVTVGDLRLSMILPLCFTAPEPPGIPLYHLDLELRTGTGLLLHKARESVTYAGQPVMAAAGVDMVFVWDIAVAAIDPAVVKAVKPGAVGLTSRLQDRDTKEMTLEGNMRLSTDDRRMLHIVRNAEAQVRQRSAIQAAEAAAKTAKARLPAAE